MAKEKLIEGNELTYYGSWVTTVAGRMAESGKDEWCVLYINVEFSMTDVDDTSLEDEDRAYIALSNCIRKDFYINYVELNPNDL